MYYLSYLLPVVAAVVAMAINGDGATNWLFYLLVVLIAAAIIYATYYILTRSKEFVSGYVVSVVHHNAWVEKIVENNSRSADGKTSGQKVSYRDHPDAWFRVLNTGLTQPVSETYFHRMCRRWGRQPFSIRVEHKNLHSGGGGEQCDWNHIELTTDTYTYTQTYRNPLRQSNPIFRNSYVAKDEARQLGLFDYPPTTNSDQNVILCHTKVGTPHDLIEANRALQRLNAFCGKAKQIHVFILLFPATAGVAVCQRQRDYWRGLNKNELVVCLGISDNRVEWCHAMCWMDSPILDVAYRRYFLDAPMLQLTAFVGYIRRNLHLWQRKSFSDFSYLGTHMTIGYSLTYWIISLFLSILILVIAIHMGTSTT